MKTLSEALLGGKNLKHSSTKLKMLGDLKTGDSVFVHLEGFYGINPDLQWDEQEVEVVGDSLHFDKCLTLDPSLKKDHGIVLAVNDADDTTKYILLCTPDFKNEATKILRNLKYINPRAKKYPADVVNMYWVNYYI